MSNQLEVIERRLQHIPRDRHQEVGRLVVHYLDTISTATPRATFYNDRQELMTAAGEVHDEMMKIDRGLYGLALALPGATDWSRQVGIANLLANKRDGKPALLDLAQETQVIHYLAKQLPITRRLKLFGILKRMRVNNTRTRKLILKSVLSDPKLEWRALKYKDKIRDALTHAWGRRTASIIRSILDKPASEWNEKEAGILVDHIPAYDVMEKRQREAIAFILGSGNVESEKLKAYYDANEDFGALKNLPPEVAEGKRSTFHADHEVAEVLELTKGKMTAGQQIAVQKSAKKRGVEVEFDPTKHNAYKLYVYAYEMGMMPEIVDALDKKAGAAAKSLPIRWRKIAVVVDTSKSMAGSGEQKNRPISVALATTDMLINSADEWKIVSVLDNNVVGVNLDGLTIPPIPEGATELAPMLIEALEFEPDAVFVITDGYENVPAGRFAEVLSKVRKMGIDTPVYQLTPTFSAEAFGTKTLDDGLKVLPIGPNTNSLGIGLMRMLLEDDFMKGIEALVGTVAQKTLIGRIV